MVLNEKAAPADVISAQGWTATPASAVREAIAPVGDAAWDAFRTSWCRLGPDRYMADGGRYRRRRHAVLDWSGSQLTPLPPRPHYQSRDYNPLNGGIARWFAQVEPEFVSSPVFMELLQLCLYMFGLSSRACTIELHQFRIEAVDTAGMPTPEGMHRDGVDFVGVFLVGRYNVTSGTTQISIDDAKERAEFTLTDPLDAVFIDDRRVRHGVTPIERVDPALSAYRDVLVLTFLLG